MTSCIVILRTPAVVEWFCNNWRLSHDALNKTILITICATELYDKDFVFRAMYPKTKPIIGTSIQKKYGTRIANPICAPQNITVWISRFFESDIFSSRKIRNKKPRNNNSSKTAPGIISRSRCRIKLMDPSNLSKLMDVKMT